MVPLSRWNARAGLMLIAVCLLTACAGWPFRRGADTRIHHIVVCWLKDPGDSAARARLLAAGDELRTIPGVSDLAVGTPLNSERPGTDAGYDVIFTMTFANNATYTAYLGHPTHQRLVHEVLEPYADHFIIYDFQPRGGSQ